MGLSLIKDGGIVPLLIEECAYEGVRRIGRTVASDIELVTGRIPRLITERDLAAGQTPGAVILCATMGHSPLLEQLMEEQNRKDAGSQKGPQIADIRGKREVYQILFVDDPFPGVDRALVICGSDKRGTIYGMFALSEYLGVTPLVFWGDSLPKRQESPVIGRDICTLSKEPSVFYRGFFINDEWPCFGTWVTERFGGFNGEAYRCVFEFLLRMKGNYLWPAMWTAAFPLDGPGAANEELADIYGVVMGYSHHEPCLRASEEWDKVRGENSPYGSEWNFYTNEQGLLRYWEDALKRSGKYENVITIGMRGERDTSMLGEEATVAENVALLKDIIRKQRQLIRRHVNEDLSKVPQMLALYKEVEAYFYGDDTVPGLKDWEELEDVICMLCEDNFGHMRTLPTEEIRDHRGGFGMYYHLDYHGGPVSYEWIDSTPLTKVWEQMCTAYEYGVRKLWIVNVGDIKFHEVPLLYFMNLAYDYDRWGTDNMHSAGEFAVQWAAGHFRSGDALLRDRITEVFAAYIDLLSLRRPEALDAQTYHPCHYLEADRMLDRVLAVERLSCEIYKTLDEEDQKGYYSMVHYPAMAGMNLLKLQLYAGKNHHYAGQGRIIANEYGRWAEECMAKDLELAEGFGRFQGGKWNGMQLASHIGFTRWNEDGCRYPVICHVTPLEHPRLSVSRKDASGVRYKNYGMPDVVRVDDFLWQGCDEVILEVANDGKGTLDCCILPEKGELPGWLEIGGDGKRQGAVLEMPLEGNGVQSLREVAIRCRREKLPRGISRHRLLVTDGDMVAAVEVSARRWDVEGLPQAVFLPRDGMVVMDAAHYAEKKEAGEAGFRVLERYGKYGSGVKVFPVTAAFRCPQLPSGSDRELDSFGERPLLVYRFLAEQSTVYKVELLAAPTNSPVPGRAVRMLVSVEGVGTKAAELAGKDFRAGDHRDAAWCRGVLDQVRSAAVEFDLQAGMHRLVIGAADAGVVLERIRIYPADRCLPESYFGQGETFFTGNAKTDH